MDLTGDVAAHRLVGKKLEGADAILGVPSRPSGALQRTRGLLRPGKLSWNRVAMTLGETALTRTPNGASSFASTRIVTAERGRRRARSCAL